MQIAAFCITIYSMKFAELKKKLTQGAEACYLLSGDDPFVISSAVKTFEQLCSLPEMNVTHLNAPTASDIVAAASVFPIMSPTRVVVVENFEKDARELKSYLSNPCEGSIIVIVSEAVTKNLSDISKLMTIVDCSRMDESVLTAYIARECGAAKVGITTQAAHLLIESCNRYMTRISVELKKLIAYKADGGVIESDDVENLVTADLEYKVFDLGDSIAAKNGPKAMAMLEEMLSGNVAAVFGMIYSHFRKLLYVSVTDEADVKKYLNISDYPYKKLKTQARQYTPVKLKKICDELHKADADYKAGLITDKLAITTFAMHLINEGK